MTKYVCPEIVNAGYVDASNSDKAESLLDCEQCRKAEGGEPCRGPEPYGFGLSTFIAMENALRGRCFCCVNAQAPKAKRASDRMYWCEHFEEVFGRKILAKSSNDAIACLHWEFDQGRF
jgi:hypothetical protein